jgi:hypothetical protein
MEAEMRLMLQQGSEESARHQAIKLMGCLIMNIAMAYAALDALYVELKVAGGFFSRPKDVRRGGPTDAL